MPRRASTGCKFRIACGPHPHRRPPRGPTRCSRVRSEQSNEEQVNRLYELLHKLPTAIHYYLHEIIFPTYTQHQHVKLSSSGQELGGSMLFPARIGFSGTPSSTFEVLF